ncbi:WD40-repeat-containing domain protein [Phascolomyces articulosus]|uniref:WD40-repeat-containing domain protein n=1 Tax=Phascolomyces articulosus TaxID=60185 RepID=A0AAD5KAX9_9FUNG|nr:WD40-repeat-containing domain protein [Phascolomyces articulosus]
MPDSSTTIATTTDHRRPLPTELLLSTFIHLDGSTLTSCAAVCREWYSIINSYDDIIWKACSLSDFQKRKTTRRFWSLHFPDPQHNTQRTPKRTWQDMYRITKNWFTGNCHGSFPVMNTAIDLRLLPQVVVGIPQEHTFATTLTMTSAGHIIRSNPTYRRPEGQQCLMIQSSWSHENEYLNETERRMHTVFCHFSHIGSKWLVTGSLDGTVALWDTVEKRMIRLWEGHRGRVLCVAMNDQVVVSGGSDSMIRVWDLNEESSATTSPGGRGMIDISSYLSARSDWIQGVGEIAVNEHLVACSPDASGPILVFSLLTGSLVYELSTTKAPLRSIFRGNPSAMATAEEEEEEEMTGFTKLCLTPFFLLTKGKLPYLNDDIPILPQPPIHHQSIPTTSPTTAGTSESRSFGYIARLDDSSLFHTPAQTTQQMTPYQLYQYYQSINNNNQSSYTSAYSSASASSSSSQTTPATSLTSSSSRNIIRGCINVWDLQTGSIVYRLVPEFDNPPPPETGYTITDIRTSPDSSKVYACIELRRRHYRQEKLFCWDFAGTGKGQPSLDRLNVMQIDGEHYSEDDGQRTSSHHRQTVGHSWVCFM